MFARLAAALVFCLAAAMPAAAETYKWVDAKGVVNYSNAPPPEAAKTGQVVEDRVSVMGMDPAVRAWAERRFADRARADELDWQQRQRSAAQQYYVQPASSGYMDSYDYGYPYYYGAAYYPRFFRAAVFNRALNNRSSPPRVSHHSHGGGAGRGGGRGGR